MLVEVRVTQGPVSGERRSEHRLAETAQEPPETGARARTHQRATGRKPARRRVPLIVRNLIIRVKERKNNFEYIFKA